MFYVVHSASNSNNTQTILALHSTLAAAHATALAAAQAFAASSSYTAQQAAQYNVTAQTFAVTQHSAEQLDEHIIATYCVADDCFNVTADIAAYCSNMLQTP